MSENYEEEPVTCRGCEQELVDPEGDQEAVYFCQEGPRCQECGPCTHPDCGPYFD